MMVATLRWASAITGMKGVVFSGATSAGIVLALSLTGFGCSNQMNVTEAAAQKVFDQLDEPTVSNLVHEASLWIDEAMSGDGNGISYRSQSIALPVAQRMGSDVWVDIDSPDGPCMVIQVPVIVDRRHACQAYVTVKPSGGVGSGQDVVPFNDQIAVKIMQR